MNTNPNKQKPVIPTAKEWKYCVVGNIVKTHHDENITDDSYECNH